MTVESTRGCRAGTPLLHLLLILSTPAAVTRCRSVHLALSRDPVLNIPPSGASPFHPDFMGSFSYAMVPFQLGSRHLQLIGKFADRLDRGGVADTHLQPSKAFSLLS